MNNESDSEYEIKQIIGKGNFGKVLLGISKKTGEKVAIKIIDKLKMNKFYNSDQVKREISVIQQMEHLNIVKIYKIENNLKKYKIIMEYCEKGELYEYIVEKRRLKEEESAYYYFQLINGLEFIHSKNIVHRDLKPENLLITNDNILKIIDFGLCNFHDINKLLSTPCGSPSYASPEMVSGKKYNGVMVDIWCTGIILFAMLAGYLPFEANDNYFLFKKIIKCEIKYPDDISENALDLMKKILVSEPSKRINIKEIKKHPFYLEGKKIFGKIHGEYMNMIEKPIGNKKFKYKKINRGDLTERKNEEKKNIFFKRKNINLLNKDENEHKKIYKRNFEEINLKYRKSTENSIKKNILCFNISIENNNNNKNNNNNNKKTLCDEDNKEKIFKKKNIFNKSPKGSKKMINNKKISLTENNIDKEIIKYIKPIMSPNEERKILFNEKPIYNSSKKEKDITNKNTIQGKFLNFKKLLNQRNNSPLTSSIYPYKRPTVKEGSISLKKEFQNNERNTISSKRTLNLDNLYINTSSNLTDKNSVIVNKMFNIKKNKNDLINNSYVYKHKSFNTSTLKDDKNVYEKKHKILKNLPLDEEETANLDRNNMNIYYTLNTAQSTKHKNIRNNIIFLPNFKQKIKENPEKNLFDNVKIHKYLLNPNLTNNNQRNEKKFKYPNYYGKTLDAKDNGNKSCNYIKKNIYKYRKTINIINKVKNEELPNKDYINTIAKKVNSQKKIFMKRTINDEDNPNLPSYLLNNKNITSSSNLATKKKKIKSIIFNNQINQLNIYKNETNLNAYELNPVYFYNNSQTLKTEQNEININPPYNKRQFNTIIINKRCQTENNDDNDYDFKSINSKTNRIYKKNDNKNQIKNINKKKKNLASTLFTKEDKFNKNKDIDIKKEDIKYDKDKKNVFMKSDVNKKKKKEYLNKHNVLNIYV